MHGCEYVLFLLKNYHRLKSEIKFLEIEKRERETNNLPQLTGCLGIVLSDANVRFKDLDYNMLKRAGRIVKGELKDLEDAVETLSKIEKGLMKDIYFNLVSWISVTHKWHISESTISRYRKKSLEKIWYYMTRGISKESEGVIECAKLRRTQQERQAINL